MKHVPQPVRICGLWPDHRMCRKVRMAAQSGLLGGGTYIFVPIAYFNNSTTSLVVRIHASQFSLISMGPEFESRVVQLSAFCFLLLVAFLLRVLEMMAFSSSTAVILNIHWIYRKSVLPFPTSEDHELLFRLLQNIHPSMVIYEELPPKSHHSLLYTNDHPYPYLKP